MRKILTPLAFIDHEHLPSRRLLEHRGEILTGDRFICRHEHMVFSTGCTPDRIPVVQFILLDNITSSRLSVEWTDSEVGSPPLELTDPVRNGGIRNHDQRWPGFSKFHDGTNESDHLDGFTL